MRAWVSLDATHSAKELLQQVPLQQDRSPYLRRAHTMCHTVTPRSSADKPKTLEICDAVGPVKSSLGHRGGGGGEGHMGRLTFLEMITCPTHAS